MTQLEYNQILKEFEKLNLLINIVTTQHRELSETLNKIVENIATKDELKKLNVEIDSLKDEKEA